MNNCIYYNNFNQKSNFILKLLSFGDQNIAGMQKKKNPHRSGDCLVFEILIFDYNL